MDCIKGNIIFAIDKDNFKTLKNGYVVYENGCIVDVFEELPEKYKDINVKDYGNKLVIPGFVDLHLHATQWLNKGIGYSEELLSWLNKYTFPLESEFSSLEFAEKHYREFINELLYVGTTRAVIFSSRHYEATKLLINMLKESGIGAYVGKVNMDRNSIPELQETTENSLKETVDLVEEFHVNAPKDSLVKYILTPRFVPSTTPELMSGLAEIAEKYDLPLQSHLNENVDEVKFVKELHPDIPTFAEVYERFNLFRKDKTIMAHCIYNTDKELEILKDYGVFVAHCPISNFNLSSGIMPTRKYLEKGIKVGLGSDVSGGHCLNMAISCVAAVNASKMYYTMNRDSKALSFSEVFYLATKGGGEFFGKVGSFEQSYEFDALIIDDSDIKHLKEPTLEERLEKFIYTGTPSNIVARYCRGKEIKI